MYHRDFPPDSSMNQRGAANPDPHDPAGYAEYRKAKARLVEPDKAPPEISSEIEHVFCDLTAAARRLEDRIAVIADRLKPVMKGNLDGAGIGVLCQSDRMIESPLGIGLTELRGQIERMDSLLVQVQLALAL